MGGMIYMVSLLFSILWGNFGDGWLVVGWHVDRD